MIIQFVIGISFVILAAAVSMYCAALSNDLYKELTCIALAIIIAFVAGALIGSIRVQ